MIALGVDLLDLSVKATLLCLAAAVVTALMRRASAASRHVVWTGMFIAVLALPIARVLLPGLPVFVLAPQVLQVTVTRSVSSPTVDAGVATASPQAPIMPASSLVLLSPPQAPAAVAAPVPRTVLSPIDLVVPLWLCGMVLLWLRAAVGTARVRQLNRTATTVTDAGVLDRVHALRRLFGVRRPIVLRAYPEWMPMTWGLVRPVILAPAAVIDADGEGRDVLEPLLVHEVAHIARFDVVSAALARFAVACVWFNPFLWLAARQAQLERERACDDAVLARGVGLRASDYANQLVTLAQAARPALADDSHALAMARRSHLESRVRSILDPRTNRRATSRASQAAAAMLVIIAVPVATVRLAARTVMQTQESAAVEVLATPAPATSPMVAAAAPPVIVDIARHLRPVQTPLATPTATAQTPAPPSAPPQSPLPTPPHYVIGVNDLLGITVWRVPELSVDVRVGADGKIALPRGNAVQAAGWTLAGLKDTLTAELKRCCMADPDVIIQVREILSRQLFFFNQEAPGLDLARQNDWNVMRKVLSDRAATAEKNLGTSVAIGTISRARQAVDSLAPWPHPPSEAELLAVRRRFADAVSNLDIEERRFHNGLSTVQALADAYVAAAEALKEPGCPGSAPVAGWTCTNGNWLPSDMPRIEARLESRSYSDAELTSALKNAAIMSPDVGRADMLVGLAQRYAFTPDMVTLYVAAANGIASDPDRARVFAQPIRVKGK